MASGNGEKRSAESFERLDPESRGTEFAEGGPSCSRREEGEEDVSEESLSRVQKEVADLAEKVVKYREKGPLAFALRLEKSLAQMRSSIPSVETHFKRSNSPEDEEVSTDKEVLAQRAKLKERLAAATASIPTILLELKSCKDRLDKAITARMQRPSRNLERHLPPAS